jgi:UDP:flavonoid glycosyltransferase YjiC (YdhE family)
MVVETQHGSHLQLSIGVFRVATRFPENKQDGAMMKRILLVTLGSLGDLYPMLRLRDALREAGAQVKLAAPAIYRDECGGHDAEFIGLGSTERYADQVGHAGTGRERADGNAVTERMVFDNFEALFAQVDAAARDVDLIVTVLHAIPAHLVAEKRRLPYVMVVLSPAFTQRARHWQRHDDDAMKVPARWNLRLTELRRQYGLGRRILPYQAMFTDAASVIGLFPGFLRGDGPHVTNLQVVGHAGTGRTSTRELDPELAEFCRGAPIVFSFGSYVDSCDPQYFFAESLAACRMLGRKCLYISRYIDSPEADCGDLLTRPFVPHAAVFPQAGAIVHHGGAGTLTEACNALKPMVIVPFMHDQPYHAQRLRELVDAAVVPAVSYGRTAVAEALQKVIDESDAVRPKLQALLDAETPGAAAAAARILELIEPGFRAPYRDSGT